MNVLVQMRDPRLRRDVVAWARSAGFGASEAGDGREALRRADEIGARAALVEVGDRDGLETLEALREGAPQVALIAVGSGAEVERVIDAFRCGAHDFLRKPLDAGALQRALVRHAPAVALEGPGGDHEVLAGDPVMRRLLARLATASSSDATICIVGESGTGKSHLARWVHRSSPRRGGPLVVTPCGDLAPGAALDPPAGGTLVLDEVGELPLSLQPHVLRLVQGDDARDGRAAARIVATSRRDLAQEVAAGRFRRDLHYRLDVVTVRVPPLRQRPGDVPLLAEAFLRRFSAASGDPPAELTADALHQLASRPFRGNVRELENLMRRAALLSPARAIDLDQLDRPRAGVSAAHRSLNLRELERRTIERALEVAGGNRTAAARELGISVRTLRNKLHRYELP